MMESELRELLDVSIMVDDPFERPVNFRGIASDLRLLSSGHQSNASKMSQQTFKPFVADTHKKKKSCSTASSGV